MVKITLEVADNGIIKTIVDDNSNGAGESLEKRRVYELDNDEFHENKIKFFYELAEELDIDTGNSYDDNNLVMSLDWGANYNPSPEEIELKIKLLEAEIELLQLKLSKPRQEQSEDKK